MRDLIEKQAELLSGNDYKADQVFEMNRVFEKLDQK
jgi:hypothetical protein